MKLEQFDYIDFGGLSTRGENIALIKFKGEKGLVITDDAEVAAAARAMGSAVSAGDAATIKGLEGKVRFVLVGGVIERCESFAEVRETVVTAVSLSRSFVYIQTPWFDSDGYLLNAGLKLHWSDWTQHTMPLTSLQLLRAIQPMLRKEAVARAAIYAASPITDAKDPRILPLGAGPNSGKFNAALHGKKPEVRLTSPVYNHLVALIARKDAKIVEGATARFKDLTKLFDSMNIASESLKQVPVKQAKSPSAPAPGFAPKLAKVRVRAR